MPSNASKEPLAKQQATAASHGLQDSARQDTPSQSNAIASAIVSGERSTIQDAPPPIYSESYDTVNLHQSGLNTAAHVADDGRLDINITEESKLLSQLLSSALRKQLVAQQTSTASPDLSSQAPFPSNEGSERRITPLSLNVVIHVVGSRGDVQPFVALGKKLKAKHGHRVRVATHPNFSDFVTENGLEFFSIGGDPTELMAFMVKNPGLMPGKDALRKGDIGKRRRGMHEIIHGCWRSCFEAGDGLGLPASDPRQIEGLDLHDRPFIADVIIANPPSFAHIHCAEKLGIPLHLIFTMPWSPTQSFPHPLANIQESSTDSSMTNFLSYALVELMTWQGLGDVINRFRENELALEPLSLMWAPGLANRLRVPYTYCWSPSLIPKPKDWGQHISVSGFLFLACADDYQPSNELATFLSRGPPPLYIGFGSIVVDDPNAMTRLIFEAVAKSGQRALVSKGWGGLGAGSLDVPNNVFMLGNVPHDWLFKHVSCVVHHGGAGTTAAGLAHGKPTVVVPFFGDQPFWGAMIARAGAGPDPIHNKDLDADKLAAAISTALKPSVLQKAQNLGSQISKEDGCSAAVYSFHRALDMDSLRCSILPDHVAVWTIRNSNTKLSAFAATVLSNAGLLDSGNLQSLRTKEYSTDETPWDPIGGGASALASTIGSFMMGIADIPMEIFSIFTKKSSGAPNPDVTRSKSKDSERDEQSETLDTQSLHIKAPSETSQNVNDQQITLESAVNAGKGVARLVDVGLKSPMDFTLALAKGFHNAPKLYGDKTVRPVERVTDLRSGIRAARKGFGYGLYDGISGLVTHPVEGAKKEGFAGLIKGFGKGIGGVVLKPGAAFWSVPGYTFKGIYKELRKTHGHSVQNYIIAARTAQGFDEWNLATEAERLSVVTRWKEQHGSTSDFTRDSSSVSEPVEDLTENPRGPSQYPDRSKEAVASPVSAFGDTDAGEFERAIRESVEATSTGNSEEDDLVERAIRASLAQIRPNLPSSKSDNVNTAASGNFLSLAAGSTALSNIATDDPDVGTDDDENIIEALQLSRNQKSPSDSALKQALKESETSQRSHQADLTEEEIVINYVMRQSLAEAGYRAKPSTQDL